MTGSSQQAHKIIPWMRVIPFRFKLSMLILDSSSNHCVCECCVAMTYIYALEHRIIDRQVFTKYTEELDKVLNYILADHSKCASKRAVVIGVVVVSAGKPHPSPPPVETDFTFSLRGPLIPLRSPLSFLLLTSPFTPLPPLILRSAPSPCSPVSSFSTKRART